MVHPPYLPFVAHVHEPWKAANEDEFVLLLRAVVLNNKANAPPFYNKLPYQYGEKSLLTLRLIAFVRTTRESSSSWGLSLYCNGLARISGPVAFSAMHAADTRAAYTKKIPSLHKYDRYMHILYTHLTYHNYLCPQKSSRHKILHALNN